MSEAVPLGVRTRSGPQALVLSTRPGFSSRTSIGPDPLLFRIFLSGFVSDFGFGLTLLLAHLLWAGIILSASSLQAAPVEEILQIHPDGSVLGRTGTLLSQAGLAEAGQAVRFHFGLPQQAPERRWREDDTLPICHSRWEKNRIRYTQTVFLTCLEMDDPRLLGPAGSNAVLVVHVCGENLAGEYTDASAALAVQVGDRWLDLELKDGFAYAASAERPVLLAAVEIPATGIESTSGKQLRFRGHMPPGTSGSMTVKIPFAALEQPEAINRLRDLEFDLELGQVKRFWKKQAGTTTAAPLTFVESPQSNPK
jgi:hypothetical protein